MCPEGEAAYISEGLQHNLTLHNLQCLVLVSEESFTRHLEPVFSSLCDVPYRRREGGLREGGREGEGREGGREEGREGGREGGEGRREGGGGREGGRREGGRDKLRRIRSSFGLPLDWELPDPYRKVPQYMSLSLCARSQAPAHRQCVC